MSENKPSRRTFLGAVIGGVIGGGRAISNNKTEEEVAHDALAGGAMGAIAVNLPAVARRARRNRVEPPPPTPEEVDDEIWRQRIQERDRRVEEHRREAEEKRRQGRE